MAGRKIHANGRVYTPEEFVCEWCKTPLVLDTYYTIDGKNVCQSCRNKERCASCGFLITETKYVTLDDKTYHPDCFRCSECLVELTGKFHFEDNLFCTECILLRGGDNIEDMCNKCFMPLSGGIIKALGNRYHEDCFVCHSCFGPFPNDEFVNVKGNPFCDNCINDNSYLKSTAHLKATGQDGASRSAPSGSGSGSSGNGSGAPGSGSGYGTGAPGSGSSGYGSGAPGSGSGYGTGAPGSGSGYGTGAPGSGSSANGSGGYGTGAPGSGSGYGTGAPGSGSSANGSGGYGSGAPGSGSDSSRSGPEVIHKAAPTTEYETVVENAFLNPASLPPKGPSKYDSKIKPKYGGGMKEEKRTRDYKSKAALGFSSETDHLKDMEGLGYKTVRRKN